MWPQRVTAVTATLCPAIFRLLLHGASHRRVMPGPLEAINILTDYLIYYRTLLYRATVNLSDLITYET